MLDFHGAFTLNLQSIGLFLGPGLPGTACVSRGREQRGRDAPLKPREVWGKGSDPRHASCLLCPARSPTSSLPAPSHAGIQPLRQTLGPRARRAPDEQIKKKPAWLSHRPSVSHIPVSQSLYLRHHPQLLHAHIPASPAYGSGAAQGRPHRSHLQVPGPHGVLWGPPRTSPWPWGRGDARAAMSHPEHPKECRSPTGHSHEPKAPSSTLPFFYLLGGCHIKKTSSCLPSVPEQSPVGLRPAFPPEKHQLRWAAMIHECVMCCGTGTSPPGGQAWLWAPSRQNISGRDLGELLCSENLPSGSQRGAPCPKAHLDTAQVSFGQQLQDCAFKCHLGGFSPFNLGASTYLIWDIQPV